MNQPEFGALVERRLSKIRDTLIEKGREYGQGEDRLAHFKKAAKKLGVTPEQALKGMVVKHEVCVDDMIEHPGRITQHMIDEKLGDVLVYGILLEGLLSEKMRVPFRVDVTS